MQEYMEILLVEDDPRDVRLTMRELQTENTKTRVEVARDGAEALDFLFCRNAYQDRSFTDPPRVVLLDLKLPKVDGLSVLKAIRGDDRTKAISVVVLTSSKEQKDLVEGYKLGASAYIQKPVDFEQFRRTIKEIGMFWLVVNQPPPAQLFRN